MIIIVEDDSRDQSSLISSTPHLPSLSIFEVTVDIGAIIYIYDPTYRLV